jgi:hypothetical protein
MPKNIRIASLASLLLVLFAARGSTAQTDHKRFELGAQIVSLEQRAFDKVDCGFGGRFAFYPLARLGLEAEANFFPRDLGKPVAFSGRRTELLFGVKGGPRIGPIGLFGKLRPGLVSFAKSPQGVACLAILVFPPPLECSISMGSTNFALDMGGGIEVVPWHGNDSVPRRAPFVLRVDFGDTMIRFKGPAQTSLGRFNDYFNVHNFQANVGIAFRF